MKAKQKICFSGKNALITFLFVLLFAIAIGINLTGAKAMDDELGNLEVLETDEVSVIDTTGVDAMDNEVGNLDRLEADKAFIMNTFDKIGENFVVQVSGTSEAAKTAEPELYDSMLSKGQDILPAVLSLMAENWQGKRGSEVNMLCNDILESLGKPVIDLYEDIFSNDVFIRLYEAYVGPVPNKTPEVYTRSSMSAFSIVPMEVLEENTPSYVWWEKADPNVFIPEPDNTDNPPPDFVRWEPMLGCYIYRDAYYNEELGLLVLEQFPE